MEARIVKRPPLKHDREPPAGALRTRPIRHRRARDPRHTVPRTLPTAFVTFVPHSRNHPPPRSVLRAWPDDLDSTLPAPGTTS